MGLRPDSLLVSRSLQAREVMAAQDWGVLPCLLEERETHRLGLRGIHCSHGDHKVPVGEAEEDLPADTGELMPLYLVFTPP